VVGCLFAGNVCCAYISEPTVVFCVVFPPCLVLPCCFVGLNHMYNHVVATSRGWSVYVMKRMDVCYDFVVFS
jgi:hypothetical protein